MAAPRLDLETTPRPRRTSALGLSLVIATCTALLLALMGFQAASWRQDARVAAALVQARALADAVARVDTSSDAGTAAVQKTVSGLPGALPGMQEALVLEGTQFVAHTDAALAGSRLKRDDLAHKALYDDSRALQENLGRNTEERAKYADLQRNPYPTSIVRTGEESLYVAAPIVAAGEMRGMVALRTEPPALPAGQFAFQFSLAAAALVIAAMLIARLAGADARLPIGIVFLAVSGFLVWNQVVDGSAAFRTQLSDVTGRSHTVWKDLSIAGAAAAIPADQGVVPPEGGTPDGAAVPAPDNAAPTADSAASPAPENAASPAPDTAAPAADSAASPAPASPEAQPTQAAAPPPAPEVKDFLSAIAVDESGNARPWYQDGSSEGSRWVTSDLGVNATWTWRGLAVVLGIFALYLVLLISGVTRRMGESFVENWYAYAYVAPAVIGTALLVFGPFLFGIVLGFYTRVYSTYEFVGVQNFVDILSNVDFNSTRNFYRTLGVTVMWTVLNVSLHVSIGLALALILKDKSLRFTPIYRTLLVVPWALPNYITALIWKGMFNKEYGAINAFLALVGVEPVSWFNSFWGAFTANVVTNVWLGFPFMMVISLGALQSIPAELYEAAEVDGAGRWDQFRTITLPLLKPALFPAVILGTIWTFNQFNVIYLVSGGAPDGETDILITEAYRWAFEGRQQYGYAAAYSTIIFLILFGYTYVTNRITKSTEGAYT